MIYSFSNQKLKLQGLNLFFAILTLKNNSSDDNHAWYVWLFESLKSNVSHGYTWDILEKHPRLKISSLPFSQPIVILLFYDDLPQFILLAITRNRRWFIPQKDSFFFRPHSPIFQTKMIGSMLHYMRDAHWIFKSAIFSDARKIFHIFDIDVDDVLYLSCSISYKYIFLHSISF